MKFFYLKISRSNKRKVGITKSVSYVKMSTESESAIGFTVDELVFEISVKNMKLLVRHAVDIFKFFMIFSKILNFVAAKLYKTVTAMVYYKCCLVY